MKLYDVAQGSIEWFNLRAGIPTASEFGNLITPNGKVRTGEMPKTYLNRKLAEWWLGGPLPGWNTIDMDLGKILEEEAKPWYSLEFGQEVQNVGFITTDDGTLGCSPDGHLVEKGIEIKCPEAHTHVGYLLANELPDQYVAQVQGSMLVTGMDEWVFMSYHRRFPKLVLTIERDHTFQGELRTALDQFLASLEAGKAKMVELNGGPPRRIAENPPKPEFESDEVGIIP